MLEVVVRTVAGAASLHQGAFSGEFTLARSEPEKQCPPEQTRLLASGEMSHLLKENGRERLCSDGYIDNR